MNSDLETKDIQHAIYSAFQEKIPQLDKEEILDAITDGVTEAFWRMMKTDTTNVGDAFYDNIANAVKHSFDEKVFKNEER